ncbi:hypothetical protein KAI87_13835, partial [Myxococcota bacterium]|nr:hypothetical protein [Myxococcota bacterium]
MSYRAKSVTTRSRVSTQETLPLFASRASTGTNSIKTTATLAAVQPKVKSTRQDYTHISTGLPSLDRALRGGFPASALSLIAARPKVGTLSLMLGATLGSLHAGQRVALLSETLNEQQLHGRMVVLESRVNGYRFKAGLATDEDKLALSSARQNIPWHSLSSLIQDQITIDSIDSHLATYGSDLVMADIDLTFRQGQSVKAIFDGAAALQDIAAHHGASIVLRFTMPRASHAPNRLELPGVGAMAEAFSTVLLMHREEVSSPDSSTYATAG